MAIKKYLNVLAPPGSRRRKGLKRVRDRGRSVKGKSLTYGQWIAQCEPKLFKRPPAAGPLISVVVPCYNTPKKYIEPLFDSVARQTYKDWELCLADGSTDPRAKEYLRELAARDERITYINI